MSRSSLILILVAILLIGGAIALGTIDTRVTPRTVEKDMLNEAVAR